MALAGVIRMPGAPDSWISRLVAGTLALDGRGVVSHASAARLHRLDNVRHAEPEFLAVRGRDHVLSGIRVHSARRLEPIDVMQIRRDLPPAVRSDPQLRRAGLLRAFAVATASRTVIDLAGSRPSDEVAGALDSAVRLGLSSPTYLRRRLAAVRRRGLGGVRLLDELMLDSGGHTWLERRFLRLVRQSGIRRPRTQVVTRHGGRFVARVDFSFDPLPVVVEVSGRLGHTSEPDRRRDARRRNELQALGYSVVEFTTTDVITCPAYVLAELARHIG